MICSDELHVMREIAKKKPEKNSGLDAFQKLTYLYNCVNSQSSIWNWAKSSSETFYFLI